MVAAVTGLRCASEPQRLAGQSFELRREGDVVPGHPLENVILRNALLAERDVDDPRGEVHTRHGLDVQLLAAQGVERFGAQGIVAHGTDHAGVHAGLSGVEGEVGGCAAYLFTIGQHIPERFAHTYNNRSFHRLVLFFFRVRR